MYSGTNKGEMLWAGETPILVNRNGIPYWQSRSGRTFPVVAGGEDPPPAGAKTEDPPKPKEGEGDEGEFDKDRALATIRKLRDGEKAMKAQLKEMEGLKAEQKKRDDAEKSESEKLKEQLAESERKSAAAAQKLTETQNRIAIERAATKAGAADPDDVFRLLDTTSFEFDDSGAVTNGDDLVKDLLKKKPYLAGKASSGTTTGVPPSPRSNGSVSRDEQVTKNKDELRGSPHYQPLG